MYLESTVQKKRDCGKEVKKRVQTGWNGWRKLSEGIYDKRVACLEMVALTKRQEAELEVAELKILILKLFFLSTKNNG